MNTLIFPDFWSFYEKNGGVFAWFLNSSCFDKKLIVIFQDLWSFHEKVQSDFSWFFNLNKLIVHYYRLFKFSRKKLIVNSICLTFSASKWPTNFWILIFWHKINCWFFLIFYHQIIKKNYRDFVWLLEF